MSDMLLKALVFSRKPLILFNKGLRHFATFRDIRCDKLGHCFIFNGLAGGAISREGRETGARARLPAPKCANPRHAQCVSFEPH